MELWDWSHHHVVSGYRTPATSSERRQTVQDSHVGLGNQSCKSEPLLKCRSCLLPNDRATRLEINWADTCRRVMMSFRDRGSIGWPSKICTQLTQGFRGWYWCVPPHRKRHNNYVDWIKQVGLIFCRTEWSVISNAASAPFDKAPPLPVGTRRAAKEFLDNNKIAPTDLFLAACPILSLDQHDGVLPGGFNSPEHMVQTWESLRGLLRLS